MIYGIERLAAHRQNQRRLFISGNRTRQYRIKNKDGQYEEAVAQCSKTCRSITQNRKSCKVITNYFINWFRTKESKNQTLNFKIFNEQEVDDTDKILEGWKDYFSELYSTNNSATFELEKLELVKLQNEILENSEKDGTPIEMATLEEIQTVIKKLKTGKSPDSSGISAEHFRYSPEEVMQFLVSIVNKIFEELDIPESTTYGTHSNTSLETE